mmetsp:Transcript_685/g.1693  ORF Transcript_685/g.1693 Transcript_685/m.1693 type:complete len:327 (+) Transcript_685:124-1104(+)
MLQLRALPHKQRREVILLTVGSLTSAVARAAEVEGHLLLVLAYHVVLCPLQPAREAHVVAVHELEDHAVAVPAVREAHLHPVGLPRVRARGHDVLQMRLVRDVGALLQRRLGLQGVDVRLRVDAEQRRHGRRERAHVAQHERSQGAVDGVRRQQSQISAVVHPVVALGAELGIPRRAGSDVVDIAALADVDAIAPRPQQLEEEASPALGRLLRQRQGPKGAGGAHPRLPDVRQGDQVLGSPAEAMAARQDGSIDPGQCAGQGLRGGAGRLLPDVLVPADEDVKEERVGVRRRLCRLGCRLLGLPLQRADGALEHVRLRVQHRDHGV